MKLQLDPVIASRINAAWAKLTPDQQRRITVLLMKAHQQAVVASQQALVPSESRVVPPWDSRLGHALTFGVTAITYDLDGVLDNLEAGVIIHVNGDGGIIGTGKYELLDPGWAEAAAEWLEHLPPDTPHATFNTNPIVHQIPDDVQIGLTGDWGTGDWRGLRSNVAPSTDVRKHMALLKPDLTIHLGDTYYAGTKDEEQYFLTQLWPKASIGSLTLNSNHEMFSGGEAYFNAISSIPFEIQRGCSYFALENNNWIIVGLDSAFYSDQEQLYENGCLFPRQGPQDQLDFLRAQVAKGKRTIILTHHNALDMNGSRDASNQSDLWAQVMSAFPSNSAPDYWYWGHAHYGAWYKPQQNGTAEVLCRCCGHGGLPYGQASEMDGKPNVVWYEKRTANDPDIKPRVLNGFAMLYFHGSQIDEVFYDENGGVAWP